MKKLITLLSVSLMMWNTVFAQITERERPKVWSQLVPGARFMDRFLPMRGNVLSSDVWGASCVVPRLIDNGVEDRIWSYWGGNIQKGKDGKYHLFVCGWLENSARGHMEWGNSMVFNAVSDHLHGPFVIRNRIGKGHNPEVFQLKDGRYVLYVIDGRYMTNDVNGTWEPSKFEFNHRDRRLSDGLSNLSFARREDGSFVMVSRGGEIFISEDGISEYGQLSDKSVYPAYEGHYEDPVIWKDHIQYHLIVNDWLGRIAYYLRSKDGINWTLDPGEAYMPGIAVHENGTIEDWFKYERIKVFQDEYGRAIQANFAVIDTLKAEDKASDNHSSKNITIPLNPGLLLTILDSNPITSKTKTIRVKIQAEEGFNPQTDMDVASLRFGASPEVNYGRGCVAIKTENDGKDLIVTFDAKGNGIDENEFAPKLLGQTKAKKLIYGYARLPYVPFIEPVLSARAPVFTKNNHIRDCSVEVQNFGQVASGKSQIRVEYKKEGKTILATSGTIAELKPYEKTNVKLAVKDVFEEGVEYDVTITLFDGKKVFSTFDLKQKIKAIAKTYRIASPDSSIVVQLTEGEYLSYTVSFHGKTIIEESNLGGFEFRNEPAFGKNLKVMSTAVRTVDETWAPVVRSKHAQVRDHHNELTLFLQEQERDRRMMNVTFRVFDDGVAFRYQLFRSQFLGNRQLTKETTTFNIPGNPDTWVAEHGGFATSHESEYFHRKLDYVTEKTIAGLPFLIKQSDDCWLAITEANINHYPGFYIGSTGATHVLTLKLSPLPGEAPEGVKARFYDDMATPWRIIMIGNNPGVLIESEIIQNLNEPCAIKDPSWIKPGLCAWDHWWSGDVKMEMPVIKEYIDFASEMGWPYMLIDWQWYGPFNQSGADICVSAPQINMPEILEYAKAKNVRLWLWLYSTDVNRNSAYKKAFPVYRQWGIAGVKIDFMDRDDQDMVNWYRDIIQCAADNQLLVDFHGAYKPDGIIRTYPNMITREGLMGNEYYKFSSKMSPEHNINLAFTRMLAGQMDYTPGGFNNVTQEEFKQQTPALVANTRAAELAKFVVYESPVTVVCDHPVFVLNQPGADFLKIVPSVWDNIRFLGGSPSEYVAIAKQSGRNWFIGVLNNSKEKEINIDTHFLPAGKYEIHIWEDALNASLNPKAINTLTQTLESGKTLKVTMAKSGGYVAHIKPL